MSDLINIPSSTDLFAPETIESLNIFYRPQRPLGSMWGKRCSANLEFKLKDFGGEKSFDGDDIDEVLLKVRNFLKQLQTQKDAIDA